MYVYTPLFLCQLEFLHSAAYLRKQAPENLLVLHYVHKAKLLDSLSW